LSTPTQSHEPPYLVFPPLCFPPYRVTQKAPSPKNAPFFDSPPRPAPGTSPSSFNQPKKVPWTSCQPLGGTSCSDQLGPSLTCQSRVFLFSYRQSPLVLIFTSKPSLVVWLFTGSFFRASCLSQLVFDTAFKELLFESFVHIKARSLRNTPSWFLGQRFSRARYDALWLLPCTTAFFRVAKPPQERHSTPSPLGPLSSLNAHHILQLRAPLFLPFLLSLKPRRRIFFFFLVFFFIAHALADFFLVASSLPRSVPPPLLTLCCPV